MSVNSGTRALIDNSAFAGVMRLSCPNVAMHRRFLKNYPQHRSIDEQSLADFLTAVVVYDRILLDSSSGWNEKELKREGYPGGERIDRSSASWADQLLRLLPEEVSSLFEVRSFGGQITIDENESCRKAFDIMCSPLKRDLYLVAGEKIPNVYYADDYLYRPVFDSLNEARHDLQRLNSDELAQAMFLHRGLFLQSRAHKQGCTYMPYHYRGKMLQRLPPMIWAKSPSDGIAQARLPLAVGNRPDESDYIRSINSYYYSLLEKVSWTTYDENIPFIGAALLSSAGGDPIHAMRKALEFRRYGTFNEMFAKLQNAIGRGDRPEFDAVMKEYQKELKIAAWRLGAAVDNPLADKYYKLATFWLPSSLKKAIEAAVELLPATARVWGRKIAPTLLPESPFQLLFHEHVGAIRNA